MADGWLPIARVKITKFPFFSWHSRAVLSNRSFHSGGKILYLMVTNTATSHVWLLSEMWLVLLRNWILFIQLELSLYGQEWVVATVLDSTTLGYEKWQAWLWGPNGLGFESQFHLHQIAECPSTSHVISLALSFLIWKMGLLMPLLRFIVRIMDIQNGRVLDT